MNRPSFRWFFGHDAFISYSRADGLSYASSLAFKLGHARTSAYADIFGSEPGTTTPASVNRALRQSSVLVVLCTPAALKSAAVLEEVRQFPAGRPVLPVRLGVDQAALAQWSERVVGIATSSESAQAWADSMPSDSVVRRVAEAAGRWRQARRLRWTIGAALSVLVLLALATGAAMLNAQRLLGEAEAARQEVSRLDTQSAHLQSEIASAAKNLVVAKQALSEANEMTQIAMKQMWTAERRAVHARMDASLTAEMNRFGRVECSGGRLMANGPLMVPFQPGETRLTEAAMGMLDELAECLRDDAGRRAVELSTPNRLGGDDAALGAKQRVAVKDYLRSERVASRQIFMSDAPPAGQLIDCVNPCVMIKERWTE